MNTTGLGRKTTLFSGSFVIVGTVFVFYFHIPPLPVIAGGLLAALVTVLFHLFSKR